MVHLFVVSSYVTSYMFFSTAFGFASLLKSFVVAGDVVFAAGVFIVFSLISC